MSRTLTGALALLLGAVLGLGVLVALRPALAPASAPAVTQAPVAPTTTVAPAPTTTAPAPASASSVASGLRWDLTGSRDLWVAIPHALAEDGAWLDAVLEGLEAWQPVADHVRFKVVYGGCPADGSNCIPVYRAPMDGAVTTLGAAADGVLFGASSVAMGFDAGPWDHALLVNASCHEFGHAIGLDHSTDGTPGPCRGGVPTSGDLALVSWTYPV